MGSGVGFWVSALGACGSLVWIYVLVRMAGNNKLIPRLRDCPADEPAGGWPSLALIFAAKDEAANVERATRSMLALDYPGLTVTAVDDRSVDGTGQILDTLAQDAPHLRVVHVRELPDGWLGKCHALQAGSEIVSGTAKWLLFTDADVVFAPDALRRAIRYAEDVKADHLTCTPEVPTESLGERLFMAIFLLSFHLYAPPWDVLNRRKKAAMGIGAFNLVRSDAFRAIGGCENIRLSIDDDMKLGQALKFAGYGPAVLHAPGCIKVRWHVGMWGMIRGVEKNFFAGVDFRLFMVVLSTFFLLVSFTLPFFGLLMGPWWTRLICAAGYLSPTLILSKGEGQSHIYWYHGLFLPLMGPVFAYAFLRSTWITLRQGGVRWRDQFYPLDMLREHVRWRNGWLRELWLSTR